MQLKDLEIENFRNFLDLKVIFGNGINIISGMNGEGKTSILEAIYYLTLTKSFRTSNDTHAISYQKEHFNILGRFSSEKLTNTNIRLFSSEKEGKHLFVNKKEVKKFSDFIGTIPAVILTLEDLRLTFGGPQERRKFLDILISQVSPLYLQSLKIYRRTLQQRNALLSGGNKDAIEKQIAIWDGQLVEHGSQIILSRAAFIKFLNQNLTEHYNHISTRNDSIRVHYRSSLGDIAKTEDNTEIKAKFQKKLHLMFRYECERKSSVVGPHRDDIDFLKDDKIFKNFSSQGENKTLVIALKFLEWKYISRERNVKPILLLDDIFGELDEHRMHGLLDFLEDIGQAYITTTMHDKFKEHLASEKYILKDKKLYAA